MRLLQILHGDTKSEKLLKHESVPCILQFAVVIRTMYLNECISTGTEIKFVQNVLGKELGDLMSNGQGLFHGVPDIVLSQPLCCFVYRGDRTGLMTGFIQMIRNGICHGNMTVFDLDLAVESNRIAFVKLCSDIALIKVGDVDHPGVIHSTEFNDLQSPPNAGKSWIGGNDCLNTHRFAVLDLTDRFNNAAVFITTGEIGNEIKYRIDAETVKG